MIRLTLIVLFLLACCAPAALAQKPQRGKKVGSARPISIELPFCEQVASAKDFEYRAEQTELSVSLAKPDAVLKTTLHYRGKCMVWQHYSTDKDSLVDRVTADCVVGRVQLFKQSSMVVGDRGRFFRRRRVRRRFADR